MSLLAGKSPWLRGQNMPRPSRRGARDAERLEIGCDAIGQHPDFAHVADEAGMEVAPEEFAECGLIVVPAFVDHLGGLEQLASCPCTFSTSWLHTSIAP